MWGYKEFPWIKTVVQSGVVVRRVKEPIEPFKVPDENAVLWRYMDLAKLLTLLQNKSLFFCRIDKLGDQFEGRWSEKTLGMLRRREHLWIVDEPHQVLIQDRRSVTADKLVFPKKDRNCSAEETIKHWQERIRHPEDSLQYTYANCWYGGEEESAAMWKLYAGEEYGMAIRTSASKLLGSFTEYLPDYFGEVKYVSYDKYAIPIAALPPVFYKRSAFSHEKEVRAIIAPKQRESEETKEENTKSGISCPIDPCHLIEEIVVSPYSPVWFHEVIQNTVNNFGLDTQVRKSVIGYDEPSGGPRIEVFLTVNRLQHYFAFLPSEVSTAPLSCVQIEATSRKDAFIIARKEFKLSEQDPNLEVLTEEEYLEDYKCLPEDFKCIPKLPKGNDQDALGPDIS